MLFLMSCITMAPQVESKTTHSCDVLGLQSQVCADLFEPLQARIDQLGMSLTDQCLMYPTRRAEIETCMQKTDCGHLAQCIQKIINTPWNPKNDPDLCDAFRIRKRSLKNQMLSSEQLYLYHKSGAVCETDASLAAECILKDGQDLWQCIQKNRSLIPGDM